MPSTRDAESMRDLLKEVAESLHDILRGPHPPTNRDMAAYRRARAEFERLRIAGVEMMGPVVNALFRPYHLPPLASRMSPWQTPADSQWEQLQRCLVLLACHLKTRISEQASADVPVSTTSHQSVE